MGVQIESHGYFKLFLVQGFRILKESIRTYFMGQLKAAVCTEMVSVFISRSYIPGLMNDMEVAFFQEGLQYRGLSHQVDVWCGQLSPVPLGKLLESFLDEAVPLRTHASPLLTRFLLGDDGGSMHICNVGKLLPNYTAQQPKYSHLHTRRREIYLSDVMVFQYRYDNYCYQVKIQGLAFTSRSSASLHVSLSVF
jgi:hypothetical protein